MIERVKLPANHAGKVNAERFLGWLPGTLKVKNYNPDRKTITLLANHNGQQGEAMPFEEFRRWVVLIIDITDRTEVEQILAERQGWNATSYSLEPKIKGLAL